MNTLQMDELISALKSISEKLDRGPSSILEKDVGRRCVIREFEQPTDFKQKGAGLRGVLKGYLFSDNGGLNGGVVETDDGFVFSVYIDNIKFLDRDGRS